MTIIIDNRSDDDADISFGRNSTVGQINKVLCYFSLVGPVSKVKLLKLYCSSLYGCQLWNLLHTDISDVCIAWSKGLRRVWLPPKGSFPLGKQ